VRVEHGQQRERDAGLARGRDDAFRELRRVRVRFSRRIVVHVVKFTDAREAGLEHFHERPCRHRLEILGRHALDETIHERAPTPEIVGIGTAVFGQAGHAALEAMAVQVRHAGQRDRDPLHAGSWRGTGLERGDAAAGDFHANVIGPTTGEQCCVEVQRRMSRFRHA
jgi:hypothetical protein